MAETRQFLAYRITNTVNEKCYIGITTRSLKKRWQQHLGDARAGRGYPLHSAIRKHGAENFQIEVIREYSSFDELNAAEIGLIQLHHTLRPDGYNATMGGDGTVGRVNTPEQRAAISARLKRLHAADPSIAARISATRKGRYAGVNSTWFGKRHSAKTKARMRENTTKRLSDPLQRERLRAGVRAMHSDTAKHKAWIDKLKGRAEWLQGPSVRAKGQAARREAMRDPVRRAAWIEKVRTKRLAAWKRKREVTTHCSKGHEFTQENTRNYYGRRYCRECSRQRELSRPPRERVRQ